MTLITIHRILIRTFVAAAILFGWLSWKRWMSGGETAALIAAIAAGAVAVGGLVYLVRAPHLRGK